MILSPDQSKAFSEIMSWIVLKSQPYWRLTGFAGTGKTQLINYIIQNLDNCSYVIGTLTWRAAIVLKNKGVDAQSIHSIIYIPEELEDGKVIFHRRDTLVGLGTNALFSDFNNSLIIIDEASMVNKKMREDILSFKIPVLFVGDAGQLPSIEEDGTVDDFLYDAESKLNQVHRQALDSPIIRLSMDIRNGRHIPYGKYGDGVFKQYPDELNNTLLLRADQILCGKNDTRKQFNNEIRKLKGYDINMGPYKGESLIFTKNYKTEGLFNGTIVTAETDNDFYLKDSLSYFMDVNTGEAVQRIKPYFKDVSKFSPQITNMQDERKRWGMQCRELEKIGGRELDFSYALTVHKFQGSQAEKVIVYFEHLKNMTTDFKCKWLYTAVTRAEKRLLLVM